MEDTTDIDFTIEGEFGKRISKKKQKLQNYVVD